MCVCLSVCLSVCPADRQLVCCRSGARTVDIDQSAAGAAHLLSIDVCHRRLSAAAGSVDAAIRGGSTQLVVVVEIGLTFLSGLPSAG